MIENRDIHSYNADVVITHDKELYQVDPLNGLTIDMERKGSPSSLKFQMIQDVLEFQEGDEVRVRISKSWVFHGFIFTINRNQEGIYDIVAFDQLRYLKTKESASFVNMSVGEIVKAVCKDKGLLVGTIRDSTYKIPVLLREDTTCLDIIYTAIEETTKATGEVFILYNRMYGNTGKITLCPLKHMYRNVVIDTDVFQSYEYTSTIDKDTYNSIRVGYPSKKDGKLTYVLAEDKKSIEKWGLLQKTIKADNGWQATTFANTLLKLYNHKTKTLKIHGAMGANEVVGGSLIVVDLYLGDMIVTQNMVVDAVSHRVEDGLYSMDLELIGGEFVSTRPVQGQEANKEQGGESEKSIGYIGKDAPVAKSADWGHGITVQQLDSVLNGVLKGFGYYFLECGNAFNINPMFVALMVKKECTQGGSINSYSARVRNNFGGIEKAPGYPRLGRFAKFPDKKTGVKMMFRLLSVVYIRRWKKNTISKILNTYAPPVENNTNEYINSIKTWYKKYTGTTWTDSKLGKGIATMEEAESRLKGTSWSSMDDKVSGNEIIEKACKYALSRVGKGYSQSLRNSYLTKGAENANYFDCSSLCYFSYVYAGFLPKKGAWSTHTLRANPTSYKFKRVPLSEARRGDILWKSGHAGFYLGNGATVEANSPRQGINKWDDNLKRFNCAYRPLV